MGREDLIKELAASVGFSQVKELERTDSVFDVETGTLYCNGMAISKNVAEEAAKYFESMEKQYICGQFENKKLAMYFRCAIEAISLMTTKEGQDFAKSVVDNFNMASRSGNGQGISTKII